MPSLKSFFSSSSSASSTPTAKPITEKKTVKEIPVSKKESSKMGCKCRSKKSEPVNEISVKEDSCCCSKQTAESSSTCCGSKNKESDSDDNNDSLVISSHPEHPANLICEFCKLFYNNGWVTGTGGGISVKKDDNIYLAPSGVQKERMLPTNIFVMSMNSKEYIRKPLNLKPSACTPLFMAAYTMRNAGACIHTHSQNAVMCTLLFDKVFEISSIEQIKALPKITEPGNMWYSDKLIIPIIENTEREEELETSLRKAIEEYPSATAVLVRRHGIYVWGETVWKAKIYNEAIDYLLELAVKMKQMGIPTVKEN
ncbi:methylthioribulose 1-phosphate dehydratase [Pichia kluyveri]|uniref:Methylthioribulose-1-phosphate dehydratase n=1 Tax=Pichia kluyveri TaxID=36015 RepID=A0AAV5R479_PICKL|nr:methylthioribulose 1-phosphate dehydratase [Pichia kluyveri]